VIVHRDLKIKDLPQVIVKCIPIIGGVLIILALAKGLSYYIVDAEIPMLLTAWVKSNIGSKIIFLLLLNIALLITGCFMDIFSAIMVVVPLIIPLGNLFGIHPVHLGIIFLANMELGYLTPPVGLNLFLSSYRFNEPMVNVYKSVLPFFLIQLVSVLLITYIPILSTGLLGILKL
jgi:tripartite ATP-independent transporter DctM subunit